MCCSGRRRRKTAPVLPRWRLPACTLWKVKIMGAAVGNIIATIGQQMQTVAVGWELYERTSSAFALGMVGLVVLVWPQLQSGNLGHREFWASISLIACYKGFTSGAGASAGAWSASSQCSSWSATPTPS